MRRVHWPRFLGALACVLGLLWLLPLQYLRVTSGEHYSLTGAWSPTLEEFVLWERGPDRTRFLAEDRRLLDGREARLAMPLLFFRDVHKWDGFPLELGGKIVSYEEAQRLMRTFSIAPRLWEPAPVPLAMLLDSNPQGADLEMPDDVIRLTGDGIQFVRCQDGSVDEEKSQAYSKLLKLRGAVLPLKMAASNATTLKPFDMGALVLDGKNHLFHLRLLAGKPVCRDTGVVVEGRVLGMLVDEHQARDFWAVVVTATQVYTLGFDYRLRPFLPEGAKGGDMPSFDGRKDSLRVRLDALSACVAGQRLPATPFSPVRLLAMDREGEVLRTLDVFWPRERIEARQLAADVSSLLFPLSLQQFVNTTRDPGMYPAPREPFWRHLGLAALGAVLWCAALWLLRGRKKRAGLADYLFAVLFGLPGFLCVLAFGPLMLFRKPS